MSDPIPTIAPYGAADWDDYDHNWRAADAEWLQSRGILRFSNAAQRDSAIASGGLGPTPAIGTFVYNQTENALQMRSSDNTWQPYRSLPFNMKTVTDTVATVKIAHSAAAGGDKGMTFTPTGISTDLPLTVLGGILTANATEVSIKTGTATAKLTTDATNLVSDKAITAPGIKLTGTDPVIDATGKNAILGILDATTINATTITATGALTGGVGSVVNGVSFPGNYVQASSGFVVSAGYHYGDANGALMRYRNPSTGAVSATTYFQVNDGVINAVGGVFDIYSQMRVRDNAIQFLNSAGTHLGWGGCVVYTATALTAANYPEGTIWVSP